MSNPVDNDLEAPPPPPSESTSGTTPIAIVLRIVIVAAILGAGFAIGRNWLTNRPKAQRQRPPASAPLVQVVELKAKSHRVTIEAMGTVTASRRVALTPRVSGEVVGVAAAFEPGGRFVEGDEILRLDRADYELSLAQQRAALVQRQADLAQRRNEYEQRKIEVDVAAIQIQLKEGVLAQRRSAVEQAESALALERGQQQVARREFDLLGEKVPEDDHALVLREPQLASARASVQAAKAAAAVAEADVEAERASLRTVQARVTGAERTVEAAEALVDAARVAVEQAELNLARTVLRAPFACVVIDRFVEVGAQVGQNTQLCVLAATDEAWVKVAVPLNELRWIDLPDADADSGSQAEVKNPTAWSDGQVRHGQVTRLLSELEPAGRLAQVLVTVTDPLALADEANQQPALLLGDYVQTTIMGPELDNLIAIPRVAIRDGNRVWLRNAAKALEVRPVEPIWSDAERVYVRDGFRAGELVIVSDLSTPVEGMPLRLPGEEPSEAAQPRPEAAKQEPGAGGVPDAGGEGAGRGGEG